MMPSAAPPRDQAPPIEQLGGIATWLGSFWGSPGPPIPVSIFQVHGAIHRRRDPLPARKPLGRWFAIESELRAWAERQNGPQIRAMAEAQLDLLKPPI